MSGAPPVQLTGLWEVGSREVTAPSIVLPPPFILSEQTLRSQAGPASERSKEAWRPRALHGHVQSSVPSVACTCLVPTSLTTHQNVNNSPISGDGLSGGGGEGWSWLLRSATFPCCGEKTPALLGDQERTAGTGGWLPPHTPLLPLAPTPVCSALLANCTFIRKGFLGPPGSSL